jgi:SAM-dependent methyltransferase
MAGNPLIIGLGPWFETAAGRVLHQWSQQQLDAVVADLFGFHAVQLGLPALDALRANRMPHRWLVAGPGTESEPDSHWAADADPGVSGWGGPNAIALWCDFDALPFDSQSLDLVVLPHTLELARDPHLALREVERVLRPEGRLVLLGFNPASLWGLRQWLGRWRLRTGLGRGETFLPHTGELFGHRRVRDWLRLLSFEVEENRWGCYGLPWQSARRLDWLERAGARWWPVLGAAHIVVAVKRVRGMRLVGLLRQPARAGQATPAVALNQHSHQKHRLHEH